MRILARRDIPMNDADPMSRAYRLCRGLGTNRQRGSRPRLQRHLDTDEANAAGVSTGDLAELVLSAHP